MSMFFGGAETGSCPSMTESPIGGTGYFQATYIVTGIIFFVGSAAAIVGCYLRRRKQDDTSAGTRSESIALASNSLARGNEPEELAVVSNAHNHKPYVEDQAEEQLNGPRGMSRALPRLDHTNGWSDTEQQDYPVLSGNKHTELDAPVSHAGRHLGSNGHSVGWPDAEEELTEAEAWDDLSSGSADESESNPGHTKAQGVEMWPNAEDEDIRPSGAQMPSQPSALIFFSRQHPNATGVGDGVGDGVMWPSPEVEMVIKNTGKTDGQAEVAQELTHSASNAVEASHTQVDSDADRALLILGTSSWHIAPSPKSFETSMACGVLLIRYNEGACVSQFHSCQYQ